MNHVIGRRQILAIGGVSLIASAGTAFAAPPVIKGAGSSFAASVMRDWITEAKAALGLEIEYAASGSGDGRNRVKAGDVDFALSDEPMPAAMLNQSGLVQIPVLFGGIVPVVNLAGIRSGQLRLSAELLGAIYTGGIKMWNDPRIVAVNPGLKLPDAEIRPIAQATPNGPPSGTTFTFTQYLLMTNADWRARHGEKVTKRWAVGSMVATQADMVETMKVLPGSLGYASIGYATTRDLTTVTLRNRSGQVVAATIESLRATTARLDWTKAESLQPNLLDLPGDASWPITVATYAVLPVAPKDRTIGEAVQALFNHVVTKGEAAANRMHASALPPAAKELALHAMRQPAS